MSKYKITIDGTTYEVDVERVAEESPVSISKEPAGVKPTTPAPVKTENKEVKTAVRSPMPGMIIAIKAEIGENVHKGQAIIVLEAMKMNNEIASPCDGILSAIHTSRGAAVQGGDILFEIN